MKGPTISDHPQVLTDLHDPDLTEPGVARRQMIMRFVGGTIALVAILVILALVWEGSSPEAEIDTLDPVSVFGVDQDDVLLGAAGGGAPASASASPGVGTSFTLRVRCDGGGGARVLLDGSAEPVPDAVPCDGRVHLFPVEVDTEPRRVDIAATGTDGDVGSWVLAITR